MRAIKVGVAIGGMRIVPIIPVEEKSQPTLLVERVRISVGTGDLQSML